MTPRTEPRARYVGVHPRLEPTRLQTAPFTILAAPSAPEPVTVPISWVLKGEFEEEMESEG